MPADEEAPNPPREGLPASARRRRRRWITGALLGWVVRVAIVARRVMHVVLTAWRDDGQLQPIPAGFADDASRMNRTRVAEVVPVEGDSAAAEKQLAALLERARAEG